MLKNFSDYAVWAGRFPYPYKEDKIIKAENSNKGSSSIGLSDVELVENFIQRQLQEMEL